jgi:membrane associated rhomboid family serine protease
MSKILEDIKYEYNIGNIVNKLIYWNIGIFLASLFFYNFKFGFFEFPNWLALSSNPQVVILNFWTLITYTFLHDGFWHIFFNMLMLYFSGNLFLTFFSKTQFVGLYFLSAIFSGLVFVFCFYFIKHDFKFQLVGASGAVFAILFATTTYHPFMETRFPLIGNVKLIYITATMFLIVFLEDLSRNMGGFVSHLSGAFFGFVYIKLLNYGTDLSNIVTKSIDFITNFRSKSKKTPFRSVQKNFNSTKKMTVSDFKPKDDNQKQIDEILDKISKSGYESLNDSEKEFLFQASK